MHFPFPPRKLIYCLKATMVAVFTVAAAGVSLAQNASPTQYYIGDAYGGTAFVGTTVNVGSVAWITTGCGITQSGFDQSLTASSVSESPLIDSGTIDTSITTASTSMTSWSTVEQVNLLEGLIRGSAVKSVSSSTKGVSGFSSSASHSELVALDVAGHTFNSVPAPNTTLELSGFGKVVLNEQITYKSATESELTVNMIHVYVTVVNNSLNIKPGTEIIVAHATSGLSVVDAPAILDGTSYGTKLLVKNVVKSEPSAPEYVPCTGTGGATRSASEPGIHLPGVLTSHTLKDTAEGSVSLTQSSAHTTSTLQSLDLLNGLVQATGVLASASAAVEEGGEFKFSSSGSHFVTLSVQGHPEINANVPPNTVITINGLGKLWLHWVHTTSDEIQTRMIELVVTETNKYGLPVGADLRIAAASASLHSKTTP